MPLMKCLKEKGLCCTSLINILRLHNGVKIPESSSQFRGGTYFWYSYFRKKTF